MGLLVKNLSYTYPGSKRAKPALKNISFELEPGELLLITGAVGSGKTTLIKHLNGILRPQVGIVKVDGLEAGKKAARKKVGLLFQHSKTQLFAKNVYQEIAFGPSNFGIKGKELEFRVQETLSLLGLDPALLQKSPFSLSGGEMRKVALAGILAQKPAYLVLDEPTIGLDPEAREKFRKELESFQNLGIGIVVVTHELEEFLPLAEKILLLKEGKLAFVGRPETYLQQGYFPAPKLSEVLRLLEQKAREREKAKGGKKTEGKAPSPKLKKDIYEADKALGEILGLAAALKNSEKPEFQKENPDPEA